jgi:NAD(P)-dependent dehydrogenase (short-subunit alcohol dehydrogenase family)
MTSLSGKTALVTGASRGIGRADAVGADLSAPDGAHKLARQVRAVVGDRLDILVANAGTSKAATIEETTVEDFDKLFAVNVRAPFFLVQQLLPILGSGGCIVLVSSLAAHAFDCPLIGFGRLLADACRAPLRSRHAPSHDG